MTGLSNTCPFPLAFVMTLIISPKCELRYFSLTSVVIQDSDVSHFFSKRVNCLLIDTNCYLAAYIVKLFLTFVKKMLCDALRLFCFQKCSLFEFGKMTKEIEIDKLFFLPTAFLNFSCSGRLVNEDW